MPAAASSLRPRDTLLAHVKTPLGARGLRAKWLRCRIGAMSALRPNSAFNRDARVRVFFLFAGGGRAPVNLAR